MKINTNNLEKITQPDIISLYKIHNNQLIDFDLEAKKEPLKVKCPINIGYHFISQKEYTKREAISMCETVLRDKCFGLKLLCIQSGQSKEEIKEIIKSYIDKYFDD
jgi:hypothetical protein